MSGGPAPEVALEGRAGAGPERILSIGFGFRAAKVLHAAVELGVFDALSGGALDAADLARRCGLATRGAADFLDALVAMNLLERDEAWRYSNRAEAQAFLVPREPGYVGDLIDYLNAAQYDPWGRLAAALRTGDPQGGPSRAGGFAALYEDPARLERFMNGMSAGIAAPAAALANRFPWERHGSFADIGSAQGCLAAEIACRHPHLAGIGFDLAHAGPLFERNMRRRGVADRVRFAAGDFFADPLPPADVLVFARVLHDWGPDERQRLLAKAHHAIHPGGAVIVCETLIDDARRTNLAGFFASLNMLLMTKHGSESTAAELTAWMRAAGFRETSDVPLVGAYSAVIGFKP